MLVLGFDPEMAVSIRAARTSDAHDIAELTLQLGYKVAEHDVAERLARILSRPDQQFFMAELDGQPVGWVHTAVTEFVESGAFVVIGGLVVDRAHRKRGIGSLLMARAEEWGRAQGCSIVRLWSSSIRVESHRFYERLGYRNIKTQYSFMKSVDAAGHEALHSFVPKVES
jgi:GNAT superfamily N-acetyltransferase